ncbi:MAG: O-methyltransferase [Prevotella sp.]|nr:O-methyltransferase [Staphylococcus sp.]MCM1349978.1 O-methyltransferase [Prevotella sp.]
MNPYIETLNRKTKTKAFIALEHYANEHQVPIIQYESLMMLQMLIRTKRVKTILEIGTAIAYSALQMAVLSEEITIDTLERDEKMVELATQHIQQFGKQKQIHLHYVDALEVDLSQLQPEYDLIFIDAAKAQYQKFFERFVPLLAPQGVIVTDNILFHGCVEQSLLDSFNLSKNVQHLAKKIDQYNHFLNTLPQMETYYFDLGDGLAITMRK